MQQTIKKNVIISGVGVHLGKPVRVNIKPAPADHGIVFKRLDVDDDKSLINQKSVKISKENGVPEIKVDSEIESDDELDQDFLK